MGILGIALDLAAIGRSIVPAYIDKYGDKRPIVKWKNGEKNYQQEAATVEEIQAWDTLHRPKLWGMVTGAVSGIIKLDFDGEDGRKLVDELGLHPHRRTGSGGYQQDFKHPGFKVKTVNSKTSKEKPWAKRYPGLDIRGDGGLAMIAGNNANGPYVWLRDEANLYEPDDLSILPPDMLDILGLVPKKSKTPHIDTLLREALLMCEQDGRNNDEHCRKCV